MVEFGGPKFPCNHPNKQGNFGRWSNGGPEGKMTLVNTLNYLAFSIYIEVQILSSRPFSPKNTPKINGLFRMEGAFSYALGGQAPTLCDPSVIQRQFDGPFMALLWLLSQSCYHNFN